MCGAEGVGTEALDFSAEHALIRHAPAAGTGHAPC